MVAPIVAPVAASPLMSVEGLRRLLETPRGLVLLDVRWKLGAEDPRGEYAAGHIPGAIYVDLESDLSGPANEQFQPTAVRRHRAGQPGGFRAGINVGARLRSSAPRVRRRRRVLHPPGGRRRPQHRPGRRGSATSCWPAWASRSASSRRSSTSWARSTRSRASTSRSSHGRRATMKPGRRGDRRHQALPRAQLVPRARRRPRPHAGD